MSIANYAIAFRGAREPQNSAHFPAIATAQGGENARKMAKPGVSFEKNEFL